MDGGHGRDVSASAGRVPIILVCSTSDLELADEAAASLRTRGYDVAVLGAMFGLCALASSLRGGR